MKRELRQREVVGGRGRGETGRERVKERDLDTLRTVAGCRGCIQREAGKSDFKLLAALVASARPCDFLVPEMGPPCGTGSARNGWPPTVCGTASARVGDFCRCGKKWHATGRAGFEREKGSERGESTQERKQRKRERERETEQEAAGVGGGRGVACRTKAKRRIGRGGERERERERESERRACPRWPRAADL